MRRRGRSARAATIGAVSSSRRQPAAPAYRRDDVTRRLFAGLAAFGFLNAVLGPALPYLRAIEHISYVAGALHQVAFALGGGLAGLLATGGRGEHARARIVPTGLVGAALASLGVAYGAHAALTIAAAFAMSLFGTSALIRMWAVLSDIHGARRTVALTEGEVLVSVGSIVTPALLSALAASVLTWRGALLVGGAGVILSAWRLRGAEVPAPTARAAPAGGARVASPRRLQPTLVIVFAIVGLEFALSFWLATYLHDGVRLGRSLAVVMVSGLYVANLAGRVIASRTARRWADATALAAALALALAGAPFLLAAHAIAPAVIGIALSGAGIGALFPLTQSLHVAGSPATADASVAQVLSVAALGQLAGPLAVGVLAQASGLRTGLILLPVLTLLGLGGLAAHARG